MQVATKSPSLSEFSIMDSSQKKLHLNLVSPIIKSHSRGARFLDLVKSNKINVSPQLTKRLSLSKNGNKDLMERAEKKSADQDYLKFSNGTPNLMASPSSGILSKRKNAVIETPDSPSQNNSAKRKRVSFNDPVSTTKEYLVTEEEERQKQNSLIRCLTYEENVEQDDEDCENKENLIAPADNKKEAIIQEEVKIKTEELEVDTISMDHDYDENPQNTDITTSSEEINEDITDQEMSEDGTKLIFKDKNELMDYVAKNFTFNEIFEKLLENHDESLKRKELIQSVLSKVGENEILNEFLPTQDSKHTKMTAEQLDKTSNVINHLSKMMKLNDRIKHKVLETFSENHSKDFLSHTIQENSVSAVCQKLTIPSIINYLIHKVNVCDDNDIDFEVNRMNRAIMHYLIKKTATTHEIINDQKEVQELLKLLFTNMQKIEVLDTVHEFLRSNIIQGPF
ncbi:telomere-associated protein RIF1-like [Chironomus tepperi]|uniref:telomere-associated protein RIF1-like n=1 Tax=Chironomus tepperi TaxID=113505 RepID=UPI00391FBD18